MLLGGIIEQAQLRNVVKFQTRHLMRKFSHLKNVRANNPTVPVKDLIMNIEHYLGNLTPQPAVPNNDAATGGGGSGKRGGGRREEGKPVDRFIQHQEEDRP